MITQNMHITFVNLQFISELKINRNVLTTDIVGNCDLDLETGPSAVIRLKLTAFHPRNWCFEHLAHRHCSHYVTSVSKPKI